MIVRDEEAQLARCLASAADAVDEICVVDTGSRDRTVAIAAAHGARLAEHPWNDSFAEARNHSLALARGRWILILDADETLAPGSAAVLREIAAGAHDTPGTRTLGALARIVDVGSAGGESWALRLFRAAPEHRYVGRIHNRLGPAFDARSEQMGERLRLCDGFVIEHTGYTPDTWARKRKTERTLRLYELALRDDPDDLFTRYKHADFLRGLEDRTRAVAALDALCDTLLTRPAAERARFAWMTEAFALCAYEHLQDRDLERAARRLAEGTTDAPTANFGFVQGLVCLERCAWDAALGWFAACRSVEGPARVQAPSPGVATWRSALGMVRALRGAERHAEADRLLDEARAAYPDAEALRLESGGPAASLGSAAG